ncbi:hypothetical protein CEY00_Acc33077 [Actinidia chinensis var. chinensis]|uniref:WD repeat-containing protein n=1 Tax=Actinidia chinensis var. chinensis TaxID=1590841 RepID=A0A2R6P482_ACTCC|nr:hypothetical protein CEY00_Acc33077 [Actinidia chinensis var. chinensis]
MQKFSVHPGSVRCMVFTDDGKYILSSAISERYIALWKLDGGKNQSACCFLAMDHPAVFLDSRCVDAGNVDASGLYVVAISEMGICYFWCGKNIEELRNAKPTKISLSLNDQFSKSQKVPTIFAAKLQGTAKPASAHIFLAYGLVIKPSFEKVIVHSGSDVKLNSSTDGILLPISQSRKSKKGSNSHKEVSALDRANAEDAILPIPKVLDFHHQKKKHQNSAIVPDEVMADDLANDKRGAQAKEEKDDMEKAGHPPTICMEDRLRTLGILDNKDDLTSDLVFDSMKTRGINIEANMPQKKMKQLFCPWYLVMLTSYWKSWLPGGSQDHTVESMFFPGFVVYW